MRVRGPAALLIRWIRTSQEERALLRDISATWEQFPNWPTVTSVRARELHTMPYRSYLETPEWRLRATQIKAAADLRCAACGGGTRLQVHHLTYDRRGYERPAGLLPLCRACHKLVHRQQHSDEHAR